MKNNNNNKFERGLSWMLAVSTLLSNTASLAVENPVDTLPKAEMPKIRPQTEVNVETQITVSPEVQKVLDTEVQPQSFGIYGVKALPFEEVSAFFSPYANKKVTIAQIIELSRKVTEFYQQRGLPLSFCYIPAQNFNENIIKVVVIEGHVNSVKVEGNPGAAEEKIREIVAPLLTEKPLTRDAMERYTTMLGLLPGLRVQASLPLPQQMDGGSELLLKVDRKAFDAIGRLETVQPFTRGIFTVKGSGNTRLAEEITVSTLLSEENEKYYAATYAQPVGKEGMILRVEASSYDGRPTAELADGLQREVTSLRLSTSLSYPFMLKRDKSLIGTVALTANKFEDQITSKATGNSATVTSDVRTLSAGLAYSDSSATQARRLQLTLSKGLDSLGASREITRNFSDEDLRNPIDLKFTKYVFNYIQRNYFPDRWGTSLSATAQYSPDALPITEKVLFGGYQHGRAYRPGQLVGDSGWGITLELNRLYPFSYKLPFYQVAGLQPYALVETARSHDNTATNQRDRLSSASIGIRLLSDQPDRTSLDFSLSKAIAGGGRSNAFKDIAFGFNFGFPF
ncbi:hypothetical protein LG201_02860 [Methylobacillus gramineus]|uniref:ShlB/FhaC/HecB family hemolysin secretion/activation protein n=1 Tax=Methylobacillus gramineus TaxID=755169 RepID=UPI001CFFE54D|nr:POTRA domain-containing protein [Methylobacillus gramineus]MCB5184140.1 hypothetical protein [Methylobacillus gramineus]